jgi:hypothetical protein
MLLHRHMQAAPEPFLKAIAPSRAGLVVAVECILTLLVNSKTYEKVVLHMTFEGAKSQGRSPVKPTRMALEIGRCCINQQSQSLPGTGLLIGVRKKGFPLLWATRAL